MTSTIRVLAVDHTAGVTPYRKKFAALARRPGIDLTVLAPDRWVEASRPVTLRLDSTEEMRDGYRLRAGAVVWPGYENRGFFLSGLGAAVRAARPDILHLWEEPYSFIAFQALAARNVWAPRARALFYSAYDLERTFQYPWRPAPLYKWIELGTFRRCERATALTDQVAAVLRRKGYAGPIDIIPLALDPEDYPMRDEGAASDDPGSRRLRIGYAGRLIPVKGVDTLIRAFAAVPPGPGEAPTLRIRGDGPERGALRQLARDLGVAERVHFEDPVPHEAMPAFYHDLDVLVLASRTLPHIQEQFGRVLMEAMACGCVVIGTSSGGIPGVIGDAGVIVPEDDPGALAGAIARVRDEPRRFSELRVRGRRRVVGRFTWEANAQRLAAIYDEMMRGHPPG